MNLLLWGVFWLLTIQQPSASSGINFFSLQQDAEIGAEASAEADKTLLLVRDANLNRYVRNIGQRLVGSGSLPEFQYRFRIVNSREINSTGFPGGAIYVNRGLIEVTANEDEFAAILAHEIGHVAGRHGTSQLSRQLLVQAPITIAAGLPTNAGWRDQLVKLGVSLGVRSSFLRYHRDQEIEACLTAMRLLNGAQFNPRALGTLLEKLNDVETGEIIRRPALVFNHPQAEALRVQMDAELERLTADRRYRRNAGEFSWFQSALHKMPYPRVAEPAEVDIGPADALPENHAHHLNYFQFAYPKGWQANRNGEHGVIITPPDGVQPARSGNDITRGLIVDFMDLGERQLTLEQATDRLIVALKQPTRNQQLNIVPGAQTHTLVSDEVGLRTILVGRQCRPVVGCESEVVWLVTRMYYQSLFYMAFVAPEEEFPKYQPMFEQIIRSTRFKG